MDGATFPAEVALVCVLNVDFLALLRFDARVAGRHRDDEEAPAFRCKGVAGSANPNKINLSREVNW